MSKSYLRGASALAALLLSTSAQAQVTPEQVWQNWKNLGMSSGQSITAATENRSGDTLTVSGVSVSSLFEGGSVTATIDTVAFRDAGNGTVEVTMSPEYPVAIDAKGDDAKEAKINLLVKQPGLKLTAAGSATETRYDFTAPSVGMSVINMTVDGKPFDLKLDGGLIGLVGNYIVGTGAKTTVDSSLKADSGSISMAVNDPDPANGGTMKLTGSVANLAGTSSSALVDSETMNDMAKALAAGFSTDGAMTYGASSFSFDFADATTKETVMASGELGGGSLNIALDANRMQYGGGAKAVSLRASGSEIPFPELSMAYADSAFNFLIPVSKSDTPQDFAILTSITDLTMSNDIWGIFDPTGELPRDPATLVIDTKGKANWKMDIFSPEAANMENVPGELHALDVTDLTLRAVGAAITGAGAFTFDNTDLTTFDGVPAPTGSIDLKIVGANGLLDRLIKMGLLPEDQAMGARMMLGLFARPGEGEDTLTSKLEFKDKGFFANGQRLQ